MKVLLNISVIIFYAVISSFGLYKLKVAVSPLSFDAVVGFACYASGFLIWIIILRILPLSVGFTTAASVLIITTQILGFYLLDEYFSVGHLTGIIPILAGLGVMTDQNG